MIPLACAKESGSFWTFMIVHKDKIQIMVLKEQEVW